MIGVLAVNKYVGRVGRGFGVGREWRVAVWEEVCG